MPINVINGDGYKNVASAGIVSDGFRPGNQELSSYANFNTQLNVDFSKLDKISSQLNQQQNYQNNQQQLPNLPDVSKLNFQLQNPLANISNNAINARTFINIDPVVLDLNGDGVKLTSYNDSEVTFDVDNDGKQERTGWVTSQDGILVDDVNHDGKINNITETISEYYNPNDGSVPDVEGKYSTDGLAALKKLDSNHDGKFNNQDSKWNDLRIWQDANGDAQTDSGELKTLTEAGIREIDLTNIIQANKERNAGNVILAKSTYTNVNGEVKQVAAVDFTTNPIGYEFNDVNLGKLATAEDGTKSLVISDVNGAKVTASQDTAQNIFGNVGNDAIAGDSRDNWISGGAGSDILQGGAGDDILIIDSEDKQENIDGGDGRDVVIINSDSGVSFNLTQSHVETAVGGDGDDVLIGGGISNVFIDGGSGDDIIIGAAADDALAGSDGNDYVDGGYGDDIIRGHRGNDVLTGGAGNDYLEGGLDDDKVFGGAGNDVIMEGGGNDEVDGGDGYDLVKYNGSYKDYKISRDGANYRVQDLKTGNIDSIKNIEGVRFNDVTIKLIDGNISPLPVADIIQIQNKSDAIFISKDDLLKNDLDVEGDALTIISVTNSVGGFGELVKDGSGNVLGVRWTPDKSFIGNISFDYDVKDSKGAYTVIATNQLRLFRAKKDKRSGEINVLEKKLKSAETRLKLFQREFDIIKPLVDEENLPILRELDLQKSIAEADEQAETTRLQVANYKNEDLSELLKEIKESDMEIVTLYNQLAASKDILKRSAITSPTAGKIMNIKYHTIGAVVPPGGEMMNIVPQHEELIVEAKVRPQDIDNVAVGLKSKVVLTAYKGKKVPKLNGEVINISPDIITNEQTRESYFLARVSISKKDIEKLKDKIELYPGMPAQVFIITGSRSLVSYLFTPISDSAYKAFREE